jgi:hypothetical protein
MQKKKNKRKIRGGGKGNDNQYNWRRNRNYFEQTYGSKYEGFQTIRELNPSPFSGCAGVWVESETAPSHTMKMGP